MMDTRGRRLVQSVLEIVARTCLRAGITANAMTLAGLFTGLAAAALVSAADRVDGA